MCGTRNSGRIRAAARLGTATGAVCECAPESERSYEWREKGMFFVSMVLKESR